MMSNKPIPTVVLIVAIIAIAIMQMWALYNGINGSVMTLCIAAIALIVGVVLPTPKLK